MQGHRDNVAKTPAFACLFLAGLVVCAAGFALAQSEKRTTHTFPPPRLTTPQENPILTNTDLISVTVTVTDREGRHISGLDRRSFTVLDEGVPQEISFFGDEDLPASVGIVFDTSASMKGNKIAQAREALSRFIQTSHERDEFFLIGFNSSAKLLLEKTRDADAVAKKLTYVEPHGETALYDAVYLGVEKVGRGIHPKRVLLLISDGEDNDSRYSFGQLRRSLQECDVIIYAIGTLGRYPIKAPGNLGRDTLNKLARVTGGKAYFPESKEEMSEAFERIALELRHQYAIGYRPSNFVSDGRWHRLKVSLRQPRARQPRLLVRSREGYFAVAEPR